MYSACKLNKQGENIQVMNLRQETQPRASILYQPDSVINKFGKEYTTPLTQILFMLSALTAF